MPAHVVAAVHGGIRSTIAERRRPIEVALLGLGTIGTAITHLAAPGSDRGQTRVRPGSDGGQTGVRPGSDTASSTPSSTLGGAFGRQAPRVRISAAFVRDAERPRRCALPEDALLTTDPRDVLAARPDVLIEVLGGTEPARTLVSAALASGIPVVTANKSLLAAYGDELLDLSATTGTPLRYEAAVLAGVPFLGAPGQRVHASAVTRLTGIVNGTSNFILTRMRDDRLDCADALAEAQRLGLAEPDPRNDIEGIDAAEKLAVLVRHYGCASLDPDIIERTGLVALESADLDHARVFDGVIKPLALADASGQTLEAFVGPAFVPAAHALARIDGVNNALALHNDYGSLFFSGPGAGPTATAASVLDDVLEIAAGGSVAPYTAPPRVVPVAPTTSWFVRISGAPALPDASDIADVLGAYGVWVRRWSDADTRRSRTARWLLTFPAARDRIDRAFHALNAAAGCSTHAIRALEAA